MVGPVTSHIDHSCQLLAQAPHVHTSAALWVFPIVKDCEAVAQEIGPEGGRRVEPRQEGTYHLSFQNPFPKLLVQEQGAVCVVGVSISCALIQASLEGRVLKLLLITVVLKLSGCGLIGGVHFFACLRLYVQSLAARKQQEKQSQVWQ